MYNASSGRLRVGLHYDSEPDIIADDSRIRTDKAANGTRSTKRAIWIKTAWYPAPLLTIEKKRAQCSKEMGFVSWPNWFPYPVRAARALVVDPATTGWGG